MPHHPDAVASVLFQEPNCLHEPACLQEPNSADTLRPSGAREKSTAFRSGQRVSPLRTWLHSIRRLCHRLATAAERRGHQLRRRARRRLLPPELLEYRTLLASVMDDGTTLQIQLDADEQVSVVSNGDHYTFQSDSQVFADGGVFDASDFSGFGTDTLTLDNFAGYFTVSITDTAAGASVHFGDSGANLYQHDFHVTLDDGAASSSTVFNGATQFDQDELIVVTDRAILMQPESSLTTNDGDIVLHAVNAGDTSGETIGIRLTNANILTTGSGDIRLEGTASSAGPASDGRVGILMDQNTSVQSTGTSLTAGMITLTGTGGAGDSANRGVQLDAAHLSSHSGNVLITGQGGDGTGNANEGVSLTAGSSVSSTGTGLGAALVTVSGRGGHGESQSGNSGVALAGASQLRTIEGDIQLLGIGGGSEHLNLGIGLSGGSIIESTGTGVDAGRINLTGTGSSGQTGNHGIHLKQGPNRISSIDGDIVVSGRGGHGAEASNHGVIIASGSIQSSGTTDTAARISIEGTAGDGSPDHGGVELCGGDVTVESTTGAVEIVGIGASYGVAIRDQVNITVADADLTITGEAGHVAAENQSGISIGSSTVQSTGNGDIVVSGLVRGSAAGGNSRVGVSVSSEAVVTSLSDDAEAGTITINGAGGHGNELNHGVHLTSRATVVSNTGAILISGDGGESTDKSSGVAIQDARVESTGTETTAAIITVEGGAIGSGVRYGVLVSHGAELASIVGDISIVGRNTASNGSGIEIGYRALLHSTGVGDEAADIHLRGTSGDDIHSAAGIEFNAGSTDFGIFACDGNIQLEGAGGDGDGQNYGVSLWSGSVSTSSEVSSGLAGQIWIRGEGGRQGIRNSGVSFGPSSVSVLTEAGTLLIEGFGGRGADSYGVSVGSTAVQSRSGDVRIVGVSGSDTPIGDIEVNQRSSDGSVAAGNHLATFVADTMVLAGRIGVLPTYQLQVEPRADTTTRVQWKDFLHSSTLTSDANVVAAQGSGLEVRLALETEGSDMVHGGIEVVGDFSIEPGVVLDPQWLPSWTPVPGQTLTVVKRGSGSGTFDGLPEGATLPHFFEATISYVGGAGNDITLTFPEDLPQTTQTASIDQLEEENYLIRGSNGFDRMGKTVAEAGDVNGDGYPDIVVSSPNAFSVDGAGGRRGEIYLIYGGPNLSGNLVAEDIRGQTGTIVKVAGQGWWSGGTVTGGDVNGDGYSDLLIGAAASEGTPEQPARTGMAYLVYGGPSLPDVIDVHEPSGASVRLFGTDENDSTGATVAMIGDVNSDGFGDMAIASSYADGIANERHYAGEVHIVFGSDRLPQTIDLGAESAGVVRIIGQKRHEHFGSSIVKLGDVTGDSVDDLIIAAPFGDGLEADTRSTGRAYVIAGSTNLPATIDLADPTAPATVIYGVDISDGINLHLESGGDLNGDGINDIVYGASRADSKQNRRVDAGEVYIIFGGSPLPQSIDLNALGSDGVTILGVDDGDQAGRDVAIVGDVNGDGYADLAIGAPEANGPDESAMSTGEVYFVLGRAAFPEMLDLRTPGAADLLLFGSVARTRIGSQVSRAGDVDGDGLDDVLLGLPDANSSAASWAYNRGETHLIYGSSLFQPQIPAVTGPFGRSAEALPTISWRESAEAESYEVWLQLLGGSDNPVANPTVTSTTYVPDNELTIGRYRVWVRANKSDGTTSSWTSRTFSVTASPTASTNEFHSQTARPQVTWDDVPGATGYRVYVYNSTLQSVVFDQVLTGSTWTPSEDLSFGRHRVWVQPLGPGGFAGDWSPATEFQVGPQPTSPVTPTFETQPTLTWTTMDGAATYDVYLRRRGGEPQIFEGLDTNHLTLTEPFEIGEYRWWVRGRAENGRAAAWSPVAEFTIGGWTHVLSPEYRTNDFTPTIQWAPVVGATSYEIYIGGSTPLLRQAGITATAFTVPPTLNRGYTVWVRAYDQDGIAGPWSRSHRIVFPVIRGYVATLDEEEMISLDRRPTLSWTAHPNTAYFNLHLTNGDEVRDYDQITDSSWTPATPLEGDQWEWYVQPVNPNGTAGEWTKGSITFDGRPRVLGPLGSTSNATPTIRWTPVHGATRYFLQIDNTTTGEIAFIREEHLSEAHFTPDSPLAKARYRIWVQAIGADGSHGVWSTAAMFLLT